MWWSARAYGDGGVGAAAPATFHRHAQPHFGGMGIFVNLTAMPNFRLARDTEGIRTERIYDMATSILIGGASLER
jgi:hypothetical protein